MKLRPVTCIHVAAYLFSALVLGASAISFYRYLSLRWQSKETHCGLISIEGHFYLYTVGEGLENNGFNFRVIDAFPGASYGLEFKRRAPIVPSVVHEVHVLGAEFVVQKRDDFGPKGTDRYCFVPYWMFLIPPLTWMCGFHLFRLRRRRRAECNAQPLMPTENAKSD